KSPEPGKPSLMTRLLWRPGRIRAQTLALSIVPLAFLLAIFLLSTLLVDQTKRTSTWFQRSTLVLSESQRVLTTLSESNLGLVQYVTHHSAAGLNKYRRAIARIPAELANIRALSTAE